MAFPGRPVAQLPSLSSLSSPSSECHTDEEHKSSGIPGTANATGSGRPTCTNVKFFPINGNSRPGRFAVPLVYQKAPDASAEANSVKNTPPLVSTMIEIRSTHFTAQFQRSSITKGLSHSRGFPTHSLHGPCGTGWSLRRKYNWIYAHALVTRQLKPPIFI